jgi:acetolactate decarboxylase
MKRIFLLVLPLAALAVASELPQVKDYGSYRRMQHRQDYAPKVALRDAIAGPGWYAVGALSDLSGEITVVDGKVLLSFGKSMDGKVEQREAGDAQATLLATAKVRNWQTISIPRTMTQAELHAFILEQATAVGLPTEDAWPFLIRGDILDYRWHVIAEPNPEFGGHGSKATMARQYETSGKRMTAVVVGFQSGKALEGTISHPGERFHEHVTDPAQTLNGHLDAYGVAEGAQLLLPRSY